ncbi:unnamed protein product [Gemmata massiliana]|uniref:Uncharacterized protein n=1 Tax=Gemmata massiliana TaxID=1210884 RepID=A0A6P2CYP6_9BACT|nr:hypothetical protein [Gemmata massiliana]VTR94101.1 unnamed protein product [Gemmata massiliana]
MADVVFPTRVDLVNVKRLLTVVRLEAEESGWWPNSHAHPCTKSLGRPSYALLQLISAYVRLRAESEALGTIGWIKVSGWQPECGAQISRTMNILKVIIDHLHALWVRKGGYCGDAYASHETESGHFFEYPPDGTTFVTVTTPQEWPNVSVELAAVIDHCERRLATILEGPEDESFVPSERQREILKALDGRALTGAALAAELGLQDKSRLIRDEMSQLVAIGAVKNERRKGGYYRPDAAPATA